MTFPFYLLHPARPFWLVLSLVCLSAFGICARAQTETTSAIDGTVTDSLTTRPVPGAQVEILNVETNRLTLKTTDARGRFYEGLLAPGLYRIRVTMPNYQIFVRDQRLRVTDVGQLVPVPVALEPAPTPVPPPAPVTAGPLIPPPPPIVDLRAEINTRDARRGGSFSDEELTRLPIGAATFTRSFDELALLLPGVAPPPQTLGSVAGPGQGAGVGTAGQFAVNGLRSRANNFTVDGSDNNDEDIGVRRQGFLALVPQAIESVKEYQAITLLAPAQFGRNLGAQVNAVSKSGGNQLHGALYGFFNSSQLNARNPFDTTAGNAVTPVLSATGQRVLLDNNPLTVRNQSGGEDSFTLGKVGAVLGGPVAGNKTFYFFSFEGQSINATQEQSFAVPTIEQRGAFGTGASGIFQNPFDNGPTGVPLTAFARPVSGNSPQIFSLFPFPNHAGGIYGANTFTQVLPASARGLVSSLKLDHNFGSRDRAQSVTGRYNFTDDWRDIPATGEAIFSTLRPHVRTQNFSFFYNSQVSAPGAERNVFNQARFSYGRTRLRFDEVRDTEFLLPSRAFPNSSFLLNAPLIVNQTFPSLTGGPNLGDVIYRTQRLANGTAVGTEIGGPLGQINIAGF
ncbi:MAG: carboxypeptidase-like regulatory domain-containing protein, partial [Acidobacteriota bacterium]